MVGWSSLTRGLYIFVASLMRVFVKGRGCCRYLKKMLRGSVEGSDLTWKVGWSAWLRIFDKELETRCYYSICSSFLKKLDNHLTSVYHIEYFIPAIFFSFFSFNDRSRLVLFSSLSYINSMLICLCYMDGWMGRSLLLCCPFVAYLSSRYYSSVATRSASVSPVGMLLSVLPL